ncbi:MAG: hypothetical protein OES32_05380 [Acidobacteriota bacterium]|nr:hypothetical protein [Acidobacteriota bacterium]
MAVTLLAAGAAVAVWYFSDRGRFTTEPETTGLGRTVAGNDLVSDHDPAVVLRFDSAFRYAGGQKFVLYGVADAEQHFFVETTADDRLKSVYWVQYEAYLPGKRGTYDYGDSPMRVTLDDHEFYTDTDVVEFDPDRKRRRGTDGAMARQLLAGKGYVLPHDFAYARLVYLTDESRRKELMIIFIDDLASRGWTAAALQEGGAHASRRAEVEKAHLDRIRDTLRVIPLGEADSVLAYPARSSSRAAR